MSIFTERYIKKTSTSTFFSEQMAYFGLRVPSYEVKCSTKITAGISSLQ